MKKCIIFLRISKTAGKSIVKFLENNLSENNTLLQGHFVYGIHKTLSTSYSYITILRNPIERLFSTYHFAIQKITERLFLKRKYPNEYSNVLNQSFEQWIYNDNGFALDNLQTRLLSGKFNKSIAGVNNYIVNSWYNNNVPHEKVTKEDLELAIENMNNIDFVGIFEYLEKSMNILIEKLNINKKWDNTTINITKNKPSSSIINNKFKDYLHEREKFDFVLYEEFKNKFLNNI